MACVNQNYGCGGPAPQGGLDDGDNLNTRMGGNGVLELDFDNYDIGNNYPNIQNPGFNGPPPGSIMDLLSKLREFFYGRPPNDGGNAYYNNSGNGPYCNDGNAYYNNGVDDLYNNRGNTYYNNGCNGSVGYGDGQTGPTGPQTPEQIAQQASVAFLNSTSFNEHYPDGNLTRERLKTIAENKDGKFDDQAVDAARSLLDNKLAYDVIDNADRHGQLNGTTDMHDLRAAAGMTPTRQAVVSFLEDPYVMEHYGNNMTREKLTELAADPKASAEARESAQYFLDNPSAFSDLDTAKRGGHGNEHFNINDMNAYLAQGDKGIGEDQHGAGRQGGGYGATR